MRRDQARADDARENRCVDCTPEKAAAWLDCVAAMAVVNGDDDARAALPAVAEHFVQVVRRAGG